MSVTSAKGFRAAGVSAGLKNSGGLDLAVVTNDGPLSAAAAVFTSNRAKANPVIWSQEAIKSGVAKAVVLNSGGANCYTGTAGYELTKKSAELAATILQLAPTEVQVCSTGLIGMLNDANALLGGVENALGQLSVAGAQDAAMAIMTTDSVPKQAEKTVAGFTIGGMAKGAGMLAPALATMLVVITTDADLNAGELDQALKEAVRTTFNRIDSDGCQSTNDTVLLMASGAAGVKPELATFTEALRDVCGSLARQLIADAEGADHDVAIQVKNAASEEDAVEAARSVARSNLFKAAIFGKDANWGRILASVGTSSAQFDPTNLDVAINGVWVCKNSAPGEARELVDLNAREVQIEIDLKSGPHQATIWTNDLTHAYVHENSAYSS